VTGVDPIIEGRPLPDVDRVSTEFWEAAGRGELLIQDCLECGARQFYPRATCAACGGPQPRWTTASGRGAVYTFTVIRQNAAPPFAESVPYVVAMVELDEGPRMMTNISHCDPEDVYVDMPVRMYSLPIGEGLGLPFFRPIESERR
jgi:uncharacterized OB-fold protein